MKPCVTSVKRVKVEDKHKIENNLDINHNLDANIENKPRYMNSDNKQSLFDSSDKEDEVFNRGFKRLVRRKRISRSVSDSSSVSSPSSIDSVRRNYYTNLENNSQDDETLDEKEAKKLKELIRREDSALSFCLDISSNMKKGIVDFFVGNIANEEVRKQITDNIKNGHCNISDLTDELRKGEIFEYINSLGDTRLKEYQIVGVSWLLALHQNSYNGILADEMGLGKTAQTCVWLQYLFDSGKLVKPVIISCPASLLDNWTKEISIWAPRLKAIKYHGSQKERCKIADQLFEDYEGNMVDAIITTFQMLSNKMDINMAFKRLEFSYMIVDEAHNIKNSSSQRYKFMSKIQSERKLLLTGTPISNSISELSNMLIFLMPEIFNSDLLEDAYNSYKRQLSYKEKHEKANSEVLFLQQIIAPFVLRRSKQDVLSCLPKKHTFIEFCELTKVQKKQYNYEIGCAHMENDTLNSSADTNMLGRAQNQDPPEQKGLIDLIERKIQDKVNCHFGDSVSTENDKESEEGSDSNNTTEGYQYHNKSMEEEQNGQEKSQEMSGRHHYDPKYVNSIIFRMRRICNHTLLHQGHYTRKQIEELVDYLSDNVQDFKGYPRIRVEQHITQLCDYEIHQLVGRLLVVKTSPVLEKFRIGNDFILNGSCKLMKMSEIIQNTVIENKEKCLIFCHHTMLLDIIEEYINIKYDIPNFYLRLDGATPTLERQNIIEKFQNTQIPLFLLSTKAAGQGLNLTIASSVIMMDLDYNPQIEKQAEDRVHRIGQSKQVKIFKLVCKDTIEESIFNCCQSKLTLDNAFGGKNQRQV